MRKRRKQNRKADPLPLMEGSADQPELHTEAFNARDYLLTAPPEQAQTQEDFDPREWFLRDALVPETEEARLRRLLGNAGFPELELHPTGEDGAFDFRYRVENPEVYTTEQVHDCLVGALGQMGYNVVIAQIATVLDAGITSGTFWITGG